MRREKVFNRSLLILAIMSIMLFAMTITASAASGRAVTNLQQTDDTKTSVTVQWSGNYGEEYLVYLSQDRSSGYQALSSYTSTSNKEVYLQSSGRQSILCNSSDICQQAACWTVRSSSGHNNS